MAATVQDFIVTPPGCIWWRPEQQFYYYVHCIDCYFKLHHLQFCGTFKHALSGQPIPANGARALCLNALMDGQLFVPTVHSYVFFNPSHHAVSSCVRRDLLQRERWSLLCSPRWSHSVCQLRFLRLEVWDHTGTPARTCTPKHTHTHTNKPTTLHTHWGLMLWKQVESCLWMFMAASARCPASTPFMCQNTMDCANSQASEKV